MPISLPKFFQRAFAQNGGKQDVPITGDTSGGRASYDVGFPPVTRIPIVAGGIPPFGTDFNGVLYDLSQAIQYVQSGVAFPFNQDFATAIGGYEIGAIVRDSSDKSLLWINGTASNTAFPTGWTQFSLKQSTETVLGLSRIATQAETNAGSNDSVVLTPKKFVDAFKGANHNLASSGYQKLPSGLIIQWGTSNNASINPQTVTLPIAFPNQGLVVVASDLSGSYTPSPSIAICSARFLSNSQIQTATANTFSTLSADSLQWIAIGY